MLWKKLAMGMPDATTAGSIHGTIHRDRARPIATIEIQEIDVFV